MSGVTKMVINRSRWLWMDRAAMIAGTAHANPPTKGTTDRPLSPRYWSRRSPKNPTRAMYPVASIALVRPNKIMICGTKTTMPANKKNGFVEQVFTNKATIIGNSDTKKEEEVSTSQGTRQVPPTTTWLVAKVGSREKTWHIFVSSLGSFA